MRANTGRPPASNGGGSTACTSRPGLCTRAMPRPFSRLRSAHWRAPAAATEPAPYRTPSHVADRLIHSLELDCVCPNHAKCVPLLYFILYTGMAGSSDTEVQAQVKLLLRSVCPFDYPGTALKYACCHGGCSVAVAERLLELMDEADTEVADSDRQRDYVRMLDAASPPLQPPFDTTPAQWRAVYRADLMNNALYSSVSAGLKPELVQLLIERGANPLFVKDKVLRTTLLHVACAKGHRELTRLLLKAGANPDATDASGNRPGDVARMLGKPCNTQVLD